MDINLKNVRDGNYNDFQDEVSKKLKQKMASHPDVASYIDKVQKATTKIQKFKEIQEI